MKRKVLDKNNEIEKKKKITYSFFSIYKIRYFICFF